jgi:MFS family permease
MNMITAVGSAWALLVGLAFIMIGNGLQGTLLGVRASLEGFPTLTTGVVMTGYFAGFLAGSTVVPRFLNRVGHIRVFAALASLASAAVLADVVFVDPWSWTAMRLVTGFAYAGLYVVAESWLNDAATNETRGQLLSVYMVIVMGGMALGQLLLVTADPAGAKLFILVSVLVSLSLVPITLSVTRAPQFDAPEHLSLRALYRISPLGVVGAMLTGIAQGALVGMGAVYGRISGFSVEQISAFMATMMLGGILLQWPVGHLSDRFDRRRVITVTCLVGAVAAFVAARISASNFPFLLGAAFVVGGSAMPIYSLFIAYTNDYLEPGQMIAASAGLVLASGLGLSVGPASAGALMSALGPQAYFAFAGAVLAAITAFALWRMTQRSAPTLDEQHAYAPAPRTSPVAATIATTAMLEEEEEDAREGGA